MICNKNEWYIIDEISVILGKNFPTLTDKEKKTVNAFIALCHESTQAEKARREKTAEAIAEKRRGNPDYARPIREHRKGGKNEG